MWGFGASRHVLSMWARPVVNPARFSEAISSQTRVPGDTGVLQNSYSSAGVVCPMSGGSWSGPWWSGFGPDGRHNGGYEPDDRGGNGSQSSTSGYETVRIRGGKGKGKGGRHGGKGKGKAKGSKDGGVRWGISEALLMTLIPGFGPSSATEPSSATAWLDVPVEQAAAATSLTKEEVKEEPGEEFLEFSGASKWQLVVQPAPPVMGEASAERTAFIEFTKDYLRASFTEAELASMFEEVDVVVG